MRWGRKLEYTLIAGMIAAAITGCVLNPSPHNAYEVCNVSGNEAGCASNYTIEITNRN